MADKAHVETDRRLEAIEAQLARYYAKVGKELNALQAREMRSYYAQLAIKQAEVEAGELSEDELYEWLAQQATSTQTRATAKKLTERTVEADAHAADIINGSLAGIYAINQRQTLEQAKSKGRGYNVSVSVSSKRELEEEYESKANRRKSDYQRYKAQVDTIKDTRWTERHFTSAIQYGISRGFSNQRMEQAFKQALGKNYNSSVRIARTYATGIENLGRLEAARKLEAEGWSVEKQWLAAHDKRVRDTHKMQNDENRPIEEPFRNGLMYPGDRSTNDPGEFINCRCRMNINILGVPGE